ALSYVDVAGAEANLRAEARTFDVTAVADAARRSWDRMLDRVRVSGGTADERTQFYTALYHAMLGPNVFSDADGRYRGFDGQVHRAEADGPPGQGSYVERPSRVPYLARGYIPNTQSTSISPVPNGASETLEYAIDDFAIAQLATAAGRSGTAQRFRARSQNWANLFDTATGYIRPRDADGAFPPGAPVATGGGGFGQSGFQEGNAAQYTWMVPQNLRALADGI